MIYNTITIPKHISNVRKLHVYCATYNRMHVQYNLSYLIYTHNFVHNIATNDNIKYLQIIFNKFFVPHLIYINIVNLWLWLWLRLRLCAREEWSDVVIDSESRNWDLSSLNCRPGFESTVTMSFYQLSLIIIIWKY